MDQEEFISAAMGTIYKERGSIEKCKTVKELVAYRRRLLEIAYALK